MSEKPEIKKNKLEWAVFAASALIVAAVVGYLVYTAATIGGTAPDLRVTFGEAERRNDGWSVPVSVTNDGDQTAEAVRVEVTLETGRDGGLSGGHIERVEFEIAFVPRGATREGLAILTANPTESGARLNGRVTGYEKP